jgi:hypothetical protein
MGVLPCVIHEGGCGLSVPTELNLESNNGFDRVGLIVEDQVEQTGLDL